jgi:hypothetical protein
MRESVQVKLFSDSKKSGIELEINKFLEGIPPEKFIDIKLCCFDTENQPLYSALIIYKAILL